VNRLSEEKLGFTKSFLIFGNLTLLTWVFLAFFGVWSYNQIYGWLLLSFAGGAIYLILRRLGCSSCYYCKSCTSGFGRLAGAFFGKGYIKKGSVGNRTGVIAFIYLLIAVIPAAAIMPTMLQTVTLLQTLALVGVLTITIYSLTTWRNKK
jgi:hypothetical protein